MKTPTKHQNTVAYLFVVVFLVGVILPVLPEARGAEKTTGSQVRSVLVKQAPVIDGLGEDEAWKAAASSQVGIKKISGAHKGPDAVVDIKSVRTATDIYFLVSWADNTPDATHKSWVWNSSKKAYEQGSDREDVVVLSFENTGAFEVNMLAGVKSVWDIWQWKAARTNPAGYAMDKTHRYTKTKPLENAKPFPRADGTTTWIARPEDKGQSPQKSQAAPKEYQGDKVAKYVAGKPSGSAADIRAKGVWMDRRWTVEFARKLSTGNADDTAFDISKSYLMAVAVFDHSEHANHSTSAAIQLSFAAKAAAVKKTQSRWDFDGGHEMPIGWRVAETRGKGKPATWEIKYHESAPSQPHAIAITANENHGSTYNLLLAEGNKYKDLEVEVMVKAVSGKEDQGGGPVWRAKDADNYYVARWNPLEDNFRVYFVKDGKRKQLGSAKVKADPAIWHKIEIEQKGNRIVAKFDGRKLIELEDSTFSEAGMVGLWTKADATTAFDDFEVEDEDGDD